MNEKKFIGKRSGSFCKSKFCCMTQTKFRLFTEEIYKKVCQDVI